MRASPTFADELAFLTDTIEGLQAVGGEVGLFARSRKAVERYARGLDAAGIKTTLVVRSQDSDKAEGLRIATMHRVKDLEFDHMIIVGMVEGEYPAANRSHLPEE